jgi:hypothetical protein
MAEVPRESPVPSIVKQRNLEDAKVAGRLQRVKALAPPKIILVLHIDLLKSETFSPVKVRKRAQNIFTSEGQETGAIAPANACKQI